MPELPDLTVYLEHIEQRIRGEVLTGIRLLSPFVLRTVTPSVEEVCGRKVLGCSRLAKQLVIELESEHYLVIHLMISGRLQWREAGVRLPKRNGLVGFDFSSGTMIFTEASKKKRASLRLVQGAAQLAELDPGGLEVARLDEGEFAVRLHATNHTLKRALTDQHVFAGIGNSYSDEILLHARLSPFKQARTLSDEECSRLYDAVRGVLASWTDLLREKAAGEFPSKVTAFHEEMAVHGKYKKPCPVCGSPVQRIVYAQNEANYCAKCQTGGRLLSDRSLARLLKDSWPKRIEDLE